MVIFERVERLIERLATVGMFASLRLRSNRLVLSSGAPGSHPFMIPSMPAMKIAANVRYGLPAGSGGRNSTRFWRGSGLTSGMRQAAERFRAE